MSRAWSEVFWENFTGSCPSLACLCLCVCVCVCVEEKSFMYMHIMAENKATFWWLLIIFPLLGINSVNRLVKNEDYAVSQWLLKIQGNCWIRSKKAFDCGLVLVFPRTENATLLLVCFGEILALQLYGILLFTTFKANNNWKGRILLLSKCGASAVC